MIDEERLRQLYIEEARSIREIAALEGCATRVIYNALMHYRIPRRTAGFRSKQTPASTLLNGEVLRRLYLDEKRSIRAIAQECNLSTRVVYDALMRQGIPRRSHAYRGERASPTVLKAGNDTLDKEQLRRLYEDEGQSIAAIAAHYTCPPSRVRAALVAWGINRRRRGRQTYQHNEGRIDPNI